MAVSVEDAKRELLRRKAAAELARRRDGTTLNAGGGIMRTVDDFVRGAADTSAFGFSDEISAFLGAKTGIGGEAGNYDANLEAQRQRDREGGWARTAGQVAGAFTSPVAAAKTTLGAIGLGALSGGAYGFGSGENDVVERSVHAGVGGIVGGAAGGVVHKVVNALAARAANKVAPSMDELRAARDAAYQRVDDMGVEYGFPQMNQLRQGIRDTLTADGLDPVFHPRASRAMQIVDDKLTDRAQSLQELDRLRQYVRDNVTDDPGRFVERRMGRHIVDEIDDFIDSAGPQQAIRGNPEEAAAAIAKARDLHGRLRRSEAIDEALKKAEHRAGSTGSGGNVDNASRQNVRAILDSPKKSRGFTEIEKALMERIVMGDPGQNIARQVGKLSPAGNGLQQALAIGATAYNPLMGVAPGIGMVAKALADRRTAQNIDALQRSIRGGPDAPKVIVDALLRLRKAEGVVSPAVAKIAAALMEKVH